MTQVILDTMDSLGGILAGKTFNAPDEISLIKKHIKERYESDCRVNLQNDAVIITVPNSALAGTLRLQQQELITKCQLDKKRLVIRIGK